MVLLATRLSCPACLMLSRVVPARRLCCFWGSSCKEGEKFDVSPHMQGKERPPPRDLRMMWALLARMCYERHNNVLSLCDVEHHRIEELAVPMKSKIEKCAPPRDMPMMWALRQSRWSMSARTSPAMMPVL